MSALCEWNVSAGAVWGVKVGICGAVLSVCDGEYRQVSGETYAGRNSSSCARQI